ncbi:hypothetical protein ACIF80_08570 [Streptomyces sp. NPDC085927]|uniref:hypothetical protein n=1 Tax=Streptomyces sp. NPDC085927 TaxID=3365738 RepID=UPI0037D94DB6
MRESTASEVRTADETAAVKAGDARDEVENVQLVAQVEYKELTMVESSSLGRDQQPKK